MILAIIGRIETVKGDSSSSNKYYIKEDYRRIFDELNIVLFPIISNINLEKICSICDGLIITGSSNDIPPYYYNEKPIEGKTMTLMSLNWIKLQLNCFLMQINQF